MPYITPETLPLEKRCRLLVIPDDVDWLSIVNGALAVLIREENFEQLEPTDVTPQQCVEVFQEMFFNYLEGTACMIGSVIFYARETAPENTLPCDGSTYLRTDYPKLYAVLDSQYKTDADHFVTPAPPSIVGLNDRIIAR